MNLLLTFDFSSLITIGETLFHSLWQGAAFWVLAAIILKFVPKMNASLRYWVATLSVVLFFATVCQTLLMSYKNNFALDPNIDQPVIANYVNEVYQTIATSEFNTYSASLIFGILWILGLIFTLGRFVMAIIYTYWIGYKALEVIDPDIIGIKSQLTKIMAITEEISIRVTDKVTGVFTYGFIKPVIIWPTALLNNLSEDEVTMILAHELMHIKRQDYIVKVILSLINTFLYYHPFIWWANKVIDNEREYDCDMSAIRICSTQSQYAHTLIKLQELKLNLVALTTNGFSDNKNFSNRIKRLFNMPVHNTSIKARLTILLFLSMTAGLFAYKYNTVNAVEEELEAELGSETTQNNSLKKLDLLNNYNLSDTIPLNTQRKTSQVITKVEGDKTTTIKMEDGKIIDVEVNGEKIDESEFDKYTEESQGRIKRRIRGDNPELDFSDEFGRMSKMRMMDLDSMLGKIKEGFPEGDSFEGFNFNFNDLIERIDSSLSPFGSLSNFSFGLMESDSLIGGKARGFGFNSNGKNFHFDIDSFVNGFEFKLDDFMDDNDIVIKRGPETRNKGLRRLNENEEEDRRFDFMSPKKGLLTQTIEKQLNKDGLLKSGKKNKVELNHKELKINGEKMPTVIYEKYKNLYENETGLLLTKGNNIIFEIEQKEISTRKYKAF